MFYINKHRSKVFISMEFAYEEEEKCLDITLRGRSGGYMVKTILIRDGDMIIIGLIAKLVTNCINSCVVFDYLFKVEDNKAILTKYIDADKSDDKKIHNVTRNIFNKNITMLKNSELPFMYLSINNEEKQDADKDNKKEDNNKKKECEIVLFENREPHLYSITLKNLNAVEICIDSFVNINKYKEQYRKILTQLFSITTEVDKCCNDLWKLEEKIDKEGDINPEMRFLNSCLVLWTILATLDMFDLYYTDEEIDIPFDGVDKSDKNKILQSAYCVLRKVNKDIKKK